MKAPGPVHREVLDNGMVVVVQESAAAPVVALTLVARSGSRRETARTSGVTALLGRVLPKGTRRRSALEIARAAEDAGGSIESAADQEYAELRVRGLARHWRALLALLHEVATEPTLEVAEIEREREALAAQIRGLDDQPFEVASRLLARALYGEHPYGLPPSGTVESVGGLTRDDLARHLEAFYGPERLILAVSGQVAAGEVVAEAGRLFGAAVRGPAATAVPPAPSRPAQGRTALTRPTQQVHLLMGFFGPPVGHPDHVGLKVLNAALGGGMSGRLFRTLRDERGLAYAVGSFYPTRRGTGRIVAHIGTAPANVPAAEAGVREIVEGMSRSGVGDEELGRAQAHLGGAFALDLRTSARRSFYLGFFELMGVGAGYVDRYPELVRRVTGADVERVARRYLADPDRAAIALVGPG
jgi:predicted Zn-dependent peptidase